MSSVICSTGLSAWTLSIIFLKASSILLTSVFQIWYLYRTMGSLSSAVSMSLPAVDSSFGGRISKLYWTPVIGSTRLLLNLRTLSSSGCSNRQTREGLILSDLSRLICASVCGKPSSTHPLTLQSLCLSLCSTSVSTMESGTN